jgi:hypothetical protein
LEAAATTRGSVLYSFRLGRSALLFPRRCTVVGLVESTINFASMDSQGEIPVQVEVPQLVSVALVPKEQQLVRLASEGARIVRSRHLG